MYEHFYNNLTAGGQSSITCLVFGRKIYQKIFGPWILILDQLKWYTDALQWTYNILYNDVCWSYFFMIKLLNIRWPVPNPFWCDPKEMRGRWAWPGRRDGDIAWWSWWRGVGVGADGGGECEPWQVTIREKENAVGQGAKDYYCAVLSELKLC